MDFDDGEWMMTFWKKLFWTIVWAMVLAYTINSIILAVFELLMGK